MQAVAVVGSNGAVSHLGREVGGGSKKTFPAHVAGSPAVGKEAIEQLTPGLTARMKANGAKPGGWIPIMYPGQQADESSEWE